MSRNILSIVNAYITIIPDNEKTKIYKNKLIEVQTKLTDPGIAYWSPEQFGSYWKITDDILAKYNPEFHNEDWGEAIYYICINDYQQPVVQQYKHLLD